MNIRMIKSKLANIPLTAKVSIAYMICSVIQNGIGIITLPLFTRMLSTAEYGQVTIYSSWLGLVNVFVTLNLPFGSFPKAMVKFGSEKNEYITSVEEICVLFASIFLISYLFFYKSYNSIFQLPTHIIIIMIAEIIANAAIQFWAAKKRFEFKYKEVVLVILLSSIISPIVQYFFIINSEYKGYAKIVGTATVTIIIGILIFLKSFLVSRKLWCKQHWIFALKFNIPLLIYYISQMIFNTSDRIMISHICGEESAALYGVVYNLVFILNIVLTAINNSYVPWVYQKLREGKQEENNKVVIRLVILISVFVVLMVWIGPEVVYLMAGEKYMKSINVIAPIALSVLILFYSQVFINYEFYYEDKHALVISSVVAALLNIMLNYMLIPYYGYDIAAYTTLLSYIIFGILNYINSKRVFKANTEINTYFPVKILIANFIITTAICYTGVFFYEYTWVRLAIIGIVFIIILVFRKKIIEKVKMRENDIL